MKIPFIFQKETKGAVQYRECNPKLEYKTIAESVIGTLYIRKSALPSGDIPKSITVDLELSS